MAQSLEVVRGLAAELISSLSRDLEEKDGRVGRVRRYLKGDHDLPYMPKGHKNEYEALARRSITNWLPLVSETFVEGLFVDGYRPAKSAENAKAWAWWQANGLDARQGIAHRSAVDYGTGWGLVLPSKGDAPVMRALPATRVQAWYEDDDDEFPVVGLLKKGRTVKGDGLFEVYDNSTVYTVVQPAKSGEPLQIVSHEAHGLGVTPLVRFRDRLDGEARGVIAPLITLQDRVNEVVFALMIALQYASFRQRWATGLAIPVDEDPFLGADGKGTQVDTGTPNPNFGKPTESFSAAVDRLWVSDSSDAKFGDFAQTEVSGHLSAYDSTVRTLAGLAQISPNILTGDLVNLSADALAALNSQTEKRVSAFETNFGESWEQMFRLAAVAAGDKEAAKDTSAQVRWRDTEARSLAQTVDALGKIAQMLSVPAEALWERIPGVTDQDVTRWKEVASKGDGLTLLASALDRQATSTVDPTTQPVA